MKKSLFAADHPILLETAAQLSEAKKSWTGNSLLGIDTEFVRERTYRANLGLVQVSDGQTAWLVDPVRLESLEPLRDMLTDPGITKILHSGSEDLEVLLAAVGAVPGPLVDTQVACAMLGRPLQMGYHATVQWLFDIEVDKEQTRSNWCRRPLSGHQLHYAAMDVVLLPQIARALLPRLEEKGRATWMREDIARARRNAAQAPEPETAYLRVSAANRMDEEALRALRALAAWRETTAIQKNLARGFVLSDKGLANLARARPGTVQKARQLEDIHPKAIDRYGKVLIRLLADAAEDRSPIFRPEPLDAGQRRQIDALRAVVQKRAAELEVEPALLASRRELERLLRAVTDGRDIPERFTGWRRETVTNELLSIIR